jgi:hypothetical protein
METRRMIRKICRRGSISALVTVVLILLAATTFSSGCVKMLQGSTEPAQAGDIPPPATTGTDVVSALTDPTSGSVQPAPLIEMTPAKSEAVTEVAPFLTPNPYPILHAARINDTPRYNRLDRGVEFEKTYHLGGNAIGLQVNVAEGPLYVVFEVTPEYDCLKSPDSCRGSMTSPVNRPYMTITVRDNQTHEIVAQDGYGREYSSDTGTYEFVITTTDAEGTTTTTTTSSGPRYIAVYKEGVFHITIEGNYLDVNVKILTGAMPSKLDIETGATPAPVKTQEGIPPEWW